MADASRAGVLKPTIQKFYRVAGSSTQLKGVESDIVLPSIIDALEVGEEYLDHAMAHDNIRRAPNFEALDRSNLFVPALIMKSEERVKASKDFAYLSEDALRMSERRKENRLSLNKEERKKELLENEERSNKRNEERRKRFALMEEADKKVLRFFRLNLADLEREELEEIDRAKEKESHMRQAKDDVAELDDTPEWPSSLDPIKREGIAILSDMVEVTERARLAGALNSNKR